MAEDDTDARPDGVMLIHRQSGGPMVDETGRVIVFDSGPEAVRFIVAHDGVGSYELREVVRYRPATPSRPTREPEAKYANPYIH